MKTTRVTTISFARSTNEDDSLARAIRLLDQAAESKPNIVAFPEACLNSRTTAQSVPGPITEVFSEKARKLGCYIIMPMIKRASSGTLHNIAVLLDPQGQVAGEYSKMFPTDYEMADGIRPGEDTPVFATPFGRIGMAICFDLNFPEVIQGLARNGAEIVFFLSAYEGGRQLERWALDNSVYIVSSHRGGVGYVIDKSGQVLQKGDPGYNPIVTRNLNMDRRIFHLDYNWKKMNQVITTYGAGVQVDVYKAEGFFALESLLPDVSIDSIQTEFGLEPYSEYIARSRRLRGELLGDATQSA